MRENKRSMKRFWHWLCHHATDRYWPLCLGVLVLLLSAPALWGRLINDDLMQRLILQGSPVLGEVYTSPFQMFDFADGNPERTQQRIESGRLPWWTLPELKYRFLRPVAVLTHMLDYRLWPNAPWLMHLHSMLWGGLCVVMIALLYRKLLPSALLAGIAALLYALDDARAVPIASLCNRNALIGLFFALGVLGAHDHWRRSGRFSGVLVACLSLLVGLLANEGSIAIGGYLLGYALFVDRGPWFRRLIALAPYGLIVLIWHSLYGRLGYGAYGSLSHTDPGAFPLTFLSNLPGYAASLFLGQWLVFPAELYVVFSPTMRIALIVAAVLLGLAVVGALWPHLRREPTLRMCALGMLLAIIPAATTLPDDRSLLFIGIGAMPLIATLILGRTQGREEETKNKGRGYRFLVGTLVVCHLVLSPLLFPLRVAAIDLVGGLLNDTVHAMVLDESHLTAQTLVVVNPPVMGIAPNISIIRAVEGKPVPRHVRDLGPNFPAEPLGLYRPDENTLVVSRPSGFPQVFFRGHPDFQYQVGDVVTLSDVDITILAMTADGLPQRVSYRFKVPLEDKSLQWIVFEGRKSTAFIPPSVGEKRTL